MTRQFDFLETPLEGLIRIERSMITDERGFFSRFFCSREFENELGLNESIMQINHTLTRDSGTVRGMHYQTPPYAEKKFVSCLTGEVWDVVIDIRRSSPTFLKWHAEVLSETNQRSMYIPEGFAHGFQTLSNNCQLVYLHSNTYEPEAEGALNALDPSINIDWPLEICQMSERDAKHQFIDALFAGVEVS